MRFFIVVIFLLFSILNISTLKAATSLGSGSGSNNELIGGDLTDPEDNGVDGSDTNWNWTSIVASEENYWTGEGAYNVFDNKVDVGDAKWCCGGAPVWIYVQFSQTYVLSHFTITSGNDVPNRDPDIWRIQGSNDGTNWTDIFLYDNDGVSPFSARHQTMRYDGSGTDFSTPAAYSYFRYYVTSTITDDEHQINELEFFGNPDSTAPTLSSSTPADNATGVLESANIVLNFSESVDVETGNITIKKTSDNSTVETINVRGGLVTGTGTSQITINPSVTLDSSTEYYVLIDATAFDDSSSNSYAGISSTTALSFTTGDNASPTLSSSSPADNATDVTRDANIVLNFSESVDVETGNITIKKTSDNSTVETINVRGGLVTGTGTSQITINPSSDLFSGFEYYVLIDATAFDDSAGNSYAGISSTTALSFTVVDMQDPTTNKDVVGLIDTQYKLANSYIVQSTSTVSSRLSYLRQNKDSNDLNDKSIIPDNWSSWSEGSISISKIGDRTNSSSSETDGQALAIGFDKKLNDNDLLGFAIQYGKSDTDVGSSGTKVDSENINLSIYRTRSLDNDNFIEGMFGVGLIENDLVRISGANTLTGSRNGTQIFGSINYGKTIDKGDFNLTPIARVDLGYTELDAYSETGTDALSYAKQTVESGLVSVGVQFNNIVKFNDNKLKPFGSIEYGMDFSISSNAKMNYVSDTSTIYTYTQGANSNHLITSVVGFEYITKDNLDIISSYKRIQGNESEQTDILNVSVNFKSKRETEYAMSIDGSEDLKAGFDITKNVNGFDLKFNANHSLSENSDQAANISLSRSF